MGSVKSTKVEPSKGANTSRLGMSDAKKAISTASVDTQDNNSIKKPSFGLKRPTTAVGSQSSQPASRTMASNIGGIAKASVTTSGGLKRPTKVENKASVP
jgi:hypothetical protein